ncbi:MAG: bifunctional hydroxymethylpyrimidine kinase/phosphomethylpyrimidine kinase [Desulfovibrionaceae bacterium]|nr:bifunctional hydroxymethylpyrimidine kinase/phosphomethylpyrimidine kinase [Desulfovibrionaceae bacterium]
MRKTIEDYKDIVQSWKNVRVLILGDAMLDEYIIGNATRISPEAPVPVVHAQDYKTHLGGACNVARNIKALGGTPILVSFVGDDTYADRLRELLKEEDIESCLFTLPHIHTTVKTRVVIERQQIVRIDRENIAHPSEEVVNDVVNAVQELITDIDVVIYSDYAKGFFTASMIDELKKVWGKQEQSPKILVDPKVSNISLFTDVFLITPNSKETHESTGVAIGDEDGLYKAARILFDRCNCSHVLTTLGERGMALFTSRENMEYVHGIRQDVFDVTGAGDVVIATIAFALANGTDIRDAVWIANYAGSYSVRHFGVVAITQENLLEAIS